MSGDGERRSQDQLFDLSKKQAVVVGGAGLLGSRIARALATFGAGVAIADINTSEAQKVAREIADDTGASVVAVDCDVRSPESVATMVDVAQEELGSVDVLCNCAVHRPTDLRDYFAQIEDYGLDTWRDVMSVDVDGAFILAKSVGRLMKQQGTGGSIIHVSSIYGLVGPDSRIYEGAAYRGVEINTPPSYAVSKAAIIGLTRYLAACWAPYEIRVNALVPGGVESGQNERFQRAYGARTPLGRMADSDEIVGAAVYLAADASSYTTGQLLVVDGGWTCW